MVFEHLHTTAKLPAADFFLPFVQLVFEVIMQIWFDECLCYSNSRWWTTLRDPKPNLNCCVVWLLVLFVHFNSVNKKSTILWLLMLFLFYCTVLQLSLCFGSCKCLPSKNKQKNSKLQNKYITLKKRKSKDEN